MYEAYAFPRHDQRTTISQPSRTERMTFSYLAIGALHNGCDTVLISRPRPPRNRARTAVRVASYWPSRIVPHIAERTERLQQPMRIAARYSKFAAELADAARTVATRERFEDV